MHRPGLMAPPDLYEQPARQGLMRPAAAAPAPLDLRLFLWSIAVVVAAIELCLQRTAG